MSAFFAILLAVLFLAVFVGGGLYVAWVLKGFHDELLDNSRFLLAADANVSWERGDGGRRNRRAARVTAFGQHMTKIHEYARNGRYGSKRFWVTVEGINTQLDLTRSECEEIRNHGELLLPVVKARRNFWNPLSRRVWVERRP